MPPLRTGVAATLLALALALALAASGCSRDEQSAAHDSTARAVDALSTAAASVATSAPMLATRDALAATAIHARLAAISPDAASGIRVRVVHGRAVLDGRIRSGDAIARLVAAARDTPGVTSVRSAIEVDPTVPALDAKVGDAALAARVRGALLAQSGLNAFEIRLAVRNGVVTLGGRAKTRALATTIVSAARGVRGVRTVVDRIRVDG